MHLANIANVLALQPGAALNERRPLPQHVARQMGPAVPTGLPEILTPDIFPRERRALQWPVIPFSLIPDGLSMHSRRRRAEEDTTSNDLKVVDLEIRPDPYHVALLAEIGVGDPPQPQRVLIDTGSSDTWFPAQGSAYCNDTGCRNGSYSSSDSSSSFLASKGRFVVAYQEKSYFTSDIMQDQLTLGKINLSNSTFGQVQSGHITGYTHSGILGLGPSDGEVGVLTQTHPKYRSLLEELKSQGQIDRLAFGIQLPEHHDEVGSLHFGGIDVTKFIPPLRGIPLSDSRTISAQLTQIKAEKLGTSTSKRDERKVFQFDPVKVILDTGTTESFLPKEILQAIIEAYGGKEKGGSYYIPSGAATDNNNILRFTLKDVSIDVPLAHFVSIQKEKSISGAAVLPRWDDEKSWSDNDVKADESPKAEPSWQDAPKQCAECSKKGSPKEDGTDKVPSRSENDDKSPDGSSDKPSWDDDAAPSESTVTKDHNDESIQIDVHFHDDLDKLKHIGDILSKHTKPDSWTDIIAKRDVLSMVSDTKGWTDAADVEHWSDTSIESVVDDSSDEKHWSDDRGWSDSTPEAPVESWSDVKDQPVDSQEHWSDAEVVEYKADDSISEDWSDDSSKWSDEGALNEKSDDQDGWSDSDPDKAWSDAGSEWSDAKEEETNPESWSDEVQDNAECVERRAGYDYDQDIVFDDKSNAEQQWDDSDDKTDAEFYWSDSYSEQVTVDKSEVDNEYSWTDVGTDKSDWTDSDNDVDEEHDQDSSWTDKHDEPSSGKDVKPSKPVVDRDEPNAEQLWADVYAEDEPEGKSYGSEEVWSDVNVDNPYSEGKSQDCDWSKSDGSEKQSEEHVWADAEADYHSSEKYTDKHVWSDEHGDEWSDEQEYDCHDKDTCTVTAIGPYGKGPAHKAVRLAGAEPEENWYRLMARPVGDQDRYILGANFLRHAYMFVDLESNKVYLGQALSSSSKDMRSVPFRNTADEQTYLSPPLNDDIPRKSAQDADDTRPLDWTMLAPNKAARIDVTTVFESTDVASVTFPTEDQSRPTDTEVTVTVPIHKTRVTSAVVYEGGVPVETHIMKSGGSIVAVQVAALSAVGIGLLMMAMYV